VLACCNQVFAGAKAESLCWTTLSHRRINLLGKRRAFLPRVLAAEGLNWRFEHDQEGDEPAEGGAALARYRVVFFDSQAALPATPRGDTLRFHGVRASDTDDAIDRSAALRHVAANAVSISSCDPAQLMALAAEQLTSLDIGEMPSLSIYDGSAERRHDTEAGADAHSRVMLQALELDEWPANKLRR